MEVLSLLIFGEASPTCFSRPAARSSVPRMEARSRHHRGHISPLTRVAPQEMLLLPRGRCCAMSAAQEAVTSSSPGRPDSQSLPAGRPPQPTASRTATGGSPVRHAAVAGRTRRSRARNGPGAPEAAAAQSTVRRRQPAGGGPTGRAIGGGGRCAETPPEAPRERRSQPRRPLCPPGVVSGGASRSSHALVFADLARSSEATSRIGDVFAVQVVKQESDVVSVSRCASPRISGQFSGAIHRSMPSGMAPTSQEQAAVAGTGLRAPDPVMSTFRQSFSGKASPPPAMLSACAVRRQASWILPRRITSRSDDR